MPVLNFVNLLFQRAWYRARMQIAQNKLKLPQNSDYLASAFFIFFFTLFSWHIFFLTPCFCYSLALKADESQVIIHCVCI